MFPNGIIAMKYSIEPKIRSRIDLEVRGLNANIKAHTTTRKTSAKSSSLRLQRRGIELLFQSSLIY